MDFMRETGVYAIINKINNKIYIGSASNNFQHRYKTHLRLLKENKHHSILLQRAINKHGLSNFQFKIIEIISDKNIILDREQYWLDKYESYNPNKGYNICKNSHNTKGFNHSEELKEKLSKERMGEDNPFYGKKHSNKVKENMNKTKRKLTLEECFNIKKLLLQGLSYIEVSEKFNYKISDVMIKRIKSGKHWSSPELGGGIKEWSGSK